MSSFFSELKRRNVIRVGIAYVIVAWLLAQIADLALDNFGTPDWVIKTVLLLLAIGMPIALLFAWAFEMTPEGLKRTHEVPADQSVTPQTGRKLDRIIIAVLAVAVVLLTVTHDWGRESESPTDVASSQGGRKSIAVLPFANLSADEENAFFAAGVHEDILTYLSKIKDLRVISRSSVMQYANQNVTAGRVAEELGVGHILEGSVRRSGNRVRVTAQLVDASSDEHLWADNFDRDLADIFEIQTAVAKEIVSALKAELSPEEERVLSSAPTDDVQAYELYLEARELLRVGSFTPERYGEAQALLEHALELDPEFVLALTLLAKIHGVFHWFNVEPDVDHRAMMKAYIDKVFDIQPDLPEARAALGEYYYRGFGEYEKARVEYEMALVGMPNDATLHHDLGLALRRLGRWEESVEIFVNATRLDPADRHYHAETLQTAFYGRQLGRAKVMADELGAQFPNDPGIATNRAITYLFGFGDIEAARVAMEPAAAEQAFDAQLTMFEIALFARDFDRAIESASNAQSMFNNNLPGFSGLLVAEALEYQGDDERARENLLNSRELVTTFIEENATKTADANVAWAYSLLASPPSGLQQHEAAHESCQQAKTIMPESRDALDGATISNICAWVWAHNVDLDGALDEIERLLEIPTGLWPAELALSPRWDFLRDNPRFQQLIAETSL